MGRRRRSWPPPRRPPAASHRAAHGCTTSARARAHSLAEALPELPFASFEIFPQLAQEHAASACTQATLSELRRKLEAEGVGGGGGGGGGDEEGGDRVLNAAYRIAEAMRLESLECRLAYLATRPISLYTLQAMATYLGVSLRTHPQLLWIASAALCARLPAGWNEGVAADGLPFYYHAELGAIMWEHPAHAYWRGLVRFVLETEAERAIEREADEKRLMPVTDDDEEEEQEEQAKETEEEQAKETEEEQAKEQAEGDGGGAGKGDGGGAGEGDGGGAGKGDGGGAGKGDGGGAGEGDGGGAGEGDGGGAGKGDGGGAGKGDGGAGEGDGGGAGEGDGGGGGFRSAGHRTRGGRSVGVICGTRETRHGEGDSLGCSPCCSLHVAFSGQPQHQSTEDGHASDLQRHLDSHTHQRVGVNWTADRHVSQNLIDM